jgi:hypothetical protein
MRRLHLFEFNDQNWLPTSWRDWMTDYLHFVSTRFNIYAPVAPKLKQTLESINCNTVVDLCSGGTGPAIMVQQQMSKQNYYITITLTDLYPNLRAFQNASATNGNVRYIETPVDATNTAQTLRGFRTIFNAFHHFNPDMAKKILANAVKNSEGIGIFEITERSLKTVLSILLTPIIVLAVTPFIKPLSLGRLLWTYIIPMMPLLILWDGVVSCLRSYSPQELKELAESIDKTSYHWESGQLDIFGVGKITYLIGYPQKALV